MPPKVKTEQEKRQLKTLIMDAARDLFVTKGIEAVSMREIARRIGYSATSIYLYFEDKEALLHAVCEHDFMQLAASLKTILAIENPVERLHALGLGYANFALTHPNHYRIMFMGTYDCPPPEESAVPQNSLEHDAYFQLKTVVSDVYLAKLFKDEFDDVELLTQTIWAGIHGVCSLQISLGTSPWIDWRTVEKRLETMQNIMMLGLLKNA